MQSSCSFRGTKHCIPRASCQHQLWPFYLNYGTTYIESKLAVHSSTRFSLAVVVFRSQVSILLRLVVVPFSFISLSVYTSYMHTVVLTCGALILAFETKTRRLYRNKITTRNWAVVIVAKCSQNSAMQDRLKKKWKNSFLTWSRNNSRK